ncbi:protein of unknown function [Azospirillum baldaniorum]|uniref:Uncharacterized protein n=1 Tax=Azospirillum baldaniorum TaxID=1064539 RepID=A0A9P1NMP8_9PROT|nr:protein of unknown function [Azospirillum baldaniorum]
MTRILFLRWRYFLSTFSQARASC